eukprot:TRINITY_DN3371_c0_g1_i3.p1 TRINITY_DN3371_c0_g1~~TRINITY_DN3371_c0_g1_i3.p1  ORF type:complete len:519 (+),score=181.75 TRINITY_DN3371_c0_g1_i3:584-2140(+)
MKHDMLQPYTRVENISNGVRGTVRYHGLIEDSPDHGVYVGVEWDEGEGGKYDGEIFGKRYFTAPAKSSSFLKEGKVCVGGVLCDALVTKYECAELHAKSLQKGSSEYDEKFNSQARSRVMNVHVPKAVQRDSNGVFSKLVNVSASGMKVSTCGALSSLFPNLTDLSLSFTLWHSWHEVANVLRSLPHLSVLSLSGNRFEPLTEACNEELRDSAPPPLTSLSLTNTNLTWNEVVSFSSLFPTLKELNCNDNKYKEVVLRDLPSLHTLRLDNNDVETWRAVAEGLSSLEGLTSLHLSGNPLRSVDMGVPRPNGLRRLYLRRTEVRDWGSVDAIREMGVEELSLSDTPLTKEQTEHERRCLVVARVPTLKTFNRGVVGRNERVDCERFFVRYYHGCDDPPAVWHDLVAVHGRLRPLAQIDMSPKLTANVMVKYIHIEEEVEAVLNVRQTIGFMYSTLCKPFSLDPAKVVMTHVDPEVAGTPHERQVLRTRERQIHTYRIKDGDCIEVREKTEGEEEDEECY